jgi:hypothetical protein
MTGVLRQRRAAQAAKDGVVLVGGIDAREELVAPRPSRGEKGCGEVGPVRPSLTARQAAQPRVM